MSFTMGNQVVGINHDAYLSIRTILDNGKLSDEKAVAMLKLVLLPSSTSQQDFSKVDFAELLEDLRTAFC